MFAAVADEFADVRRRAPEAKFNEAMSYASQAPLDGRQPLEVTGRRRARRPASDLIARFRASKEAADVSWFVAEDLKRRGEVRRGRSSST